MAKRVQSPSSINTHKQCPRRYFYQYVLKLPTYPNIHTLRGNAVHEALEHFFDIDLKSVDPTYYKQYCAAKLRKLFHEAWSKKSESFSKLGMLPEKLQFYYDESTLMLATWVSEFFRKLDIEMKDKDFNAAFEKLKPFAREVKYKSDKHMVRGFIDVVEDNNGKIRLVDYKTSKFKDGLITPAYRLQLGIYALMYQEKHGKIPEEASIWFLRNKEIVIPITEQMVKDAEFEVEQIHMATESDSIIDFPKKITGLCKWATGQCDFYDACVRAD